ncbi:ADP-ribosyltransferase [Ancylobacter lacus]|uniref:ADP-ribosyltransferase n=1 Tax=Ancylobacter lacus TaxID=2579970 RepID=UPI001BCA9086|nr:ADP-ribosyltransferase [Ancylobacter lacus]MBS7539753.1 hypothetical protein [Ancylobacter lacus]
MDDRERERRFRRERRAQLARSVLIQSETYNEIVHYLTIARNRVLAALAGTPTQFETWRLGQLQVEVRRALEAFERGATDVLMTGIDRSWAAGSDLVTAPLAAGGIDIGGRLPALDLRLLTALKSFQTDRIRDISTTTVNKVNQEIGQAAIGVQSPFAAAQKVGELIDAPAARARTIVRTELGTAYSEAGQQRMEQAVKLGVTGLQKQWRRSGKLHPRITHELADGQIVDVDKPFRVGGIDIMKPRDPALDPKDRINCGCSSLPFMRHWRVSTPGAKPYSAEELARSQVARVAEEVRAAPTPTPVSAELPPRSFASPIEEHYVLQREYAAWAGSLAREERHAINVYKTSAGYTINEALRKDAVSPAIERHIASLDAALSTARLPAPTRLWHGEGPQSPNLKLRPGDVSAPAAGYFSSSIRREMAQGNADGGIIVEFVLPAGYPAAYINGVPFPIDDTIRAANVRGIAALASGEGRVPARFDYGGADICVLAYRLDGGILTIVSTAGRKYRIDGVTGGVIDADTGVELL